MSAQRVLIPSAEPFLLPAGKAACLLLHGFTGTPREMRGLGEYLHVQGFTVLAPRLAGHATQMADLTRMTWRDWLASVEDGWHLLRSAGYGPIVVVGFSLGGALALLFASHFPVAGVVTLSAPYRLPRHPLLPFLRPLSKVWRYMAKAPSDALDAEAERDNIAYPANPLHGIAEVRDLLAVMREALPQVRVPALVIHARRDRTVPPENATLIVQALGTADKDLVWIERSGHAIPREPDREHAFRATAAFARRVTAAQEDAS